LKKRPPAGQAGTAPDRDGQDGENRGLTEAAIGPERPGGDLDRRIVSGSVSAALARAIAALDRGDVAEARELLESLADALTGRHEG
jgi:hypothetical protein